MLLSGGTIGSRVPSVRRAVSARRMRAHPSFPSCSQAIMNRAMSATVVVAPPAGATPNSSKGCAGPEPSW